MGYDIGLDRIFLVSPIIIVHEIDEDSPPTGWARRSWSRRTSRSWVILEGMVEATAMTTQARSPTWPARSCGADRFRARGLREKSHYKVDYSRLHKTPRGGRHALLCPGAAGEQDHRAARPARPPSAFCYEERAGSS